jgi:hypothetical protein
MMCLPKLVVVVIAHGQSKLSAVGFPVVGFSPFATLHNPINTSLRTMTSLQSLLSIFTSSNCAELTIAPDRFAPVKSAPVKFACPRLALDRFALTNVASVKSAPNNEIPVKLVSLKFARFKEPLVKYSPVPVKSFPL